MARISSFGFHIVTRCGEARLSYCGPPATSDFVATIQLPASEDGSLHESLRSNVLLMGEPMLAIWGEPRSRSRICSGKGGSDRAWQATFRRAQAILELAEYLQVAQQPTPAVMVAIDASDRGGFALVRRDDKTSLLVQDVRSTLDVWTALFKLLRNGRICNEGWSEFELNSPPDAMTSIWSTIATCVGRLVPSYELSVEAEIIL